MGKNIWKNYFGYDVSARPPVRILRVVESRNDFLPSPLKSFVPYCFKRSQKALEIISNQNLSTEQTFGGF